MEVEVKIEVNEQFNPTGTLFGTLDVKNLQ